MKKCIVDIFIGMSNKSAYLKVITALVYRSSPPRIHEQSYLNFYEILEIQSIRFQQLYWKIKFFLDIF